MLTKRDGKGMQDLSHDWNKMVQILRDQDNHTMFTKEGDKWMFFENIFKF